VTAVLSKCTASVLEALSMNLHLYGKVIFKKLMDAELVKKFSTFLRNLKTHLSCPQGTPLDPVLSQINPVHTVM
jgi:hypothetical protein